MIDVAVEMRGPLYRVTRLSRNAEAAMCGVLDQARVRYLPPLKAPLVTRRTRTAWPAGALALDHQRGPSAAHCRAMGLLLCLELLRLRHKPRDPGAALRAIQHPQLRNVARYLADVLRWVERRATPEHEWMRTFMVLLLPWIVAHPCRAMMPGQNFVFSETTGALQPNLSHHGNKR